jgi:ribose 5-phosphate isomerase A
MNLKQEAAKAAIAFIRSGTAVGLGAGATMVYMVEFLKEVNPDIQLYTSSSATRTVLEQNGFKVNDIAAVAYLDVYFDGCDQFDKDLNAFKSGGGIHTDEKLFASMAKEFILVGDESKYAEQLTNKYPLVVEVLPQAITYAMADIRQLFAGVNVNIRYDVNNDIIVTRNGNYLLDVRFDVLPEIRTMNPTIKSLTGIVETSLFYNMAAKAIIAGDDGVRILERRKSNML